MAVTEAVLSEAKDGLLTLTLNRPEKLNALNFESFKALASHVRFAAENTATVGCVVLTGAGRSFCAGNDLGDLGGVFEGGDGSHFRSATIENLAALPMPVIAAVRGHCLTGGLELALAADIIIAAESARFGDTHGKWDLVPVWGLSQRLPRRVGRAKALEMSFTARHFTGREAAEIGLANFCVPDAELDEAVAAFARDVLANSWRSSRAIKRLVDDTEGLPLKAGLAHEIHRSEGRGPETAERLQRMRK
ncbi:MAG: enoyl-CoA hydratase/isomerase family protein [Alphaproteobacteria bacterium]|nr:enoyl-CoA hydratase/isomerase family protein [Alphaproteobacteria bacterium]